MVRRWSFFDPVPELIRRGSPVFEDGSGLDRFGRSLPVILYELQQADPSAFDRVVSATRTVLGVPEKLEVRKDQEEERFYFVQYEKGLQYPVHQLGASAGTLRILALMTALYGGENGTQIYPEEQPDAIRKALEESGFGLGAFYETKGFGA